MTYKIGPSKWVNGCYLEMIDIKNSKNIIILLKFYVMKKVYGNESKHIKVDSILFLHSLVVSEFIIC